MAERRNAAQTAAEGAPQPGGRVQRAGEQTGRCDRIPAGVVEPGGRGTDGDRATDPRGDRPPTRPVTRAGRARTAVAGPGAASVVLVVPVAGYFACGWARTTVLMILSAIVWRLVSHSGNSQPT